MTTKNTGGAAFPTLDHNGHALVCREFGMSLRDWLSGNAPLDFRDACYACGFLDYQEALMTEGQRAAAMNVLAMLRLEYADAMLAARGADQ